MKPTRGVSAFGTVRVGQIILMLSSVGRTSMIWLTHWGCQVMQSGRISINWRETVWCSRQVRDRTYISAQSYVRTDTGLGAAIPDEVSADTSAVDGCPN
jgi:hypothetical protein